MQARRLSCCDLYSDAARIESQTYAALSDFSERLGVTAHFHCGNAGAEMAF